MVRNQNLSLSYQTYLCLIAQQILRMRDDSQQLCSTRIPHSHFDRVAPRVVVARILTGDAQRQEHHRVQILLETQHRTNVRIEARENDPPIAGFL